MRSVSIVFLISFFLSSDLSAKSIEDSFLKGDIESTIYQIESFDKKDKPKNIILLIGDGMGMNHITLSRLAIGGDNYQLALDQMPHIGTSTTQSSNDSITDSAAAATTWATGKKTKNKYLSMTPDKEPLQTITELLSKRGYLTGVVATSSVTHATPAAFFSHVDNRYKTKEIASQLLSSSINVAFGGGIKYFKSFDIDKEKYTLLNSKSDLLNLTTNSNKNLLGLFAEDGIMRTEKDMPSQLEMTKVALNYLSNNSKTCNGFFLMSEGSQIDWAGHSNNLEYLFAEFTDFDATIGNIINFVTEDQETLLIITADHETGDLQILDESETSVKVSWGSKNHTGVPVGVFAYGPGAHLFSGEMDNTDIFFRMLDVLDYKNTPETNCQY
jgi:alkaline phosphatase